MSNCWSPKMLELLASSKQAAEKDYVISFYIPPDPALENGKTYSRSGMDQGLIFVVFTSKPWAKTKHDCTSATSSTRSHLKISVAPRFNNCTVPDWRLSTLITSPTKNSLHCSFHCKTAGCFFLCRTDRLLRRPRSPARDIVASAFFLIIMYALQNAVHWMLTYDFNIIECSFLEIFSSSTPDMIDSHALFTWSLFSIALMRNWCTLTLKSVFRLFCLRWALTTFYKHVQLPPLHCW